MSRLEKYAESLGVDYDSLDKLSNSELRQIIGVDIPTHHGWCHHNRDMPEAAMVRLKEWVLSFKK